MADPVDEIAVGPLTLRVARREVVLADRIIGFKHWKTTAFGAQAIVLLGLFGTSLDEAWLRQRLRSEGAEDALDALTHLAQAGGKVSTEALEDLLGRLHRQSGAEER
jgi:hypothetical protein